ncbi:cobalamin biosynthesis protein [Candidatus Colwellia aromaticivorans]|uniref:cobalamin biosynthesis protein n=1 Tax=Candidatus Colwellia aromaticivorans TaxID=2267621 RepID=UPI000DF2D90D|nr:cobalamin biosynthesis protein [Candidatus Colwellia aromaticivorans]
MADFITLSSFSYQLLILLVVLGCKATISHFIRHEPLRFFQFYCQRLSDKVNKPQNSPQQQTIAGLSSVLVTLLPIAIILYLFESFIEVNILWQALLLYIAMGSFGLAHINKIIAQALVSKQNYFAKQTLKPWVLRETEPLSSLGLSKSSIEMQLLRTLQQGYAVAIIFLIGGPLAAISYRLLLEMHYCWNTKLVSYNYFGLYSKRLISLLQWLPVRVFSLLLLFTSIGKNFVLFWRLSKQHFFQLDNNIALLLLALNLEIKLGGVALYNDQHQGKQKLRKVSFNDLARQPQVTDIIHASNKIKGIIYISLFFISFIAFSLELVFANI